MADTDAQDSGQVAQPSPGPDRDQLAADAPVTALEDGQEKLYRAWMDKIGMTPDKGMNVDADYTGRDYDMRGYFKKYGATEHADGQHFTDEFKLPNHETFSDQSIYATGEAARVAGTWEGDKYKARDPNQPLPSDVEYLKSKPTAWQNFQKRFGKLPDGFEKPRPTQDDIDYLNAKPSAWKNFEKAFGALPEGWSQDSPAKLSDFKGDMPEVTVTGKKEGPESSWGDVGSAASTAIGAGEERIGAAAQETYGSTVYDKARLKFWQALTLPDALKASKASGTVLTEDPGVVSAAKHLGVRPDVFTRDWPEYADKSPEELQKLIADQKDDIAKGASHMNEGAARRKRAGEVEEAYAPNTGDAKLKNFAFEFAKMSPELLGGVGISMIPGGAIPAAAMLTTDFGLKGYSAGRDAGLDDQHAKMYGLLQGVSVGVPEIKALSLLSKAPGASKMLQSVVGKAIAESTAGKVAGSALNQGVTMDVINALQMAADKGMLDKDTTLSEAIQQLGSGFLLGTAMGGAAGGIHAGANRLAHGPAAKTPHEMENELRSQPGIVPSGNDEAILQAITDQQPVKPGDIKALAGKGLITIGKNTGKPMILPAGKRFMDEAKKARETAEGAAQTNAAIEPEKATEAEDTESAGKAPRTPDETMDAAGADQRRQSNFEELQKPANAQKKSQVDAMFQERDAETEKAKANDFVKAQNQKADEIVRNADAEGTGVKPAEHGSTGPMTMAEALATAKQAPEAVKAEIPRRDDLTPAERNVESSFIDQIGSNVNKAIEDYSNLPNTDGGRIISTDDARKLQPDYAKDPGKFSSAVHEPASWLANVMFRRALAQPPKPGQDNHAIFTSGGSGSAKTSAIFGNEKEPASITNRAQLIYDTAMESPESAMSKIDAAVDAGKFVSLVYVYRDPIESWRHGVLPRAMTDGRIVTAEAHSATHAGSPAAIKMAMEKYKDNPKVSFIALDNSNGDARSEVMDPEEALKLDSKVSVSRLNREALEALRNDEISAAVYESATGKAAPAESVSGKPAKDAEGAVPGNGDAKPSKLEHSPTEVGQPTERGAVEKLDRLEQRARRRMTEERARAANTIAEAARGRGGRFPGTTESLKANDSAGMRELLGPRNDNIRENTRFANSAHAVLDTLFKHVARGSPASDLIQALRMHMPDVPVNFVRNVLGKGGERSVGAIGNYYNGMVQVKMVVGSRAVENMIGTITHEFVHAATVSAIEADPEGPLAMKMRTLLAEARGLAGEQYGKDVVDAHLKHFANPASEQPANYNRNMYALMNVHELMAETMSNDRVQKFLGDLGAKGGGRVMLYGPTEPRGIFKKIVDGVAKFLGIKDAAGSLLADIIATTGKVIQAQPAMGFTNANLLRLGEGKPGKKDQQSRDIASDIESGKQSKLVRAAVEIGALKIVRGISRFEDWSAAMRAELGAAIKPVMRQLYEAAKDKTVDIKSLVYKTRKGGQFVGGPAGTTKDDLAPLRASLRGLAREGEFGKDWYDESSKAILDAVNGDRDDAKKLAGLMSIFSSGATVSANTTMGLRAWYQWKAGDAVHVATTAANETAQRWLDTGVEPTGMKRSNFYGNLLQALEGGDRDSMYDNGVTVDRWMMRALGYSREAPTLPQYAFVSDQIRQVAKSLKWTPTQVQAAVWVAMKTRWEQVRSEVNKEALKKGWVQQAKKRGGLGLEILDPERYYGKMFDKAMAVTLDPEHIKRSASNFRTELLKHRAQVSWEAMPGSSSRRMRGLGDIPIEHLESFQRDVAQAHVDPRTGNDQLMQSLGILSMGRVDGNSAWFTDHGQVMRFRHWSVKDGLSQLDPQKMGTSGVGMTVEERNRTNKVTALYPYDLEPGQPEKLVSDTAKHQYIVEIPAAHLYDSARDPRGYKQAAMEPVSMDSEGNPIDFAYNHDTFEQQVKDAGFTGYYVNDPGTELHGQARVFEPVAATQSSQFANTEQSGVTPYSKAGSQEIIYAPLAKGASQEPGAHALDPQARGLMQSYAAALGKLNHQDSVGWHRPRFGRIPETYQNGIELRIPDAGREDYMRVYKQMTDELRREGLTDKQAAEFAPIQTEAGLRFINWGSLDNKDFQRAAERAFGAEDLFGKKYEYTPFAADGGLIDNDWNKHPDGQGYDSVIAGNGHTARVREALSDIGGRIKEVYRDYAKRFQLNDSASASSERAGESPKASDPVPLDQLTTGVGLHDNVLRRFGSLGTKDTIEQLKLYDLKHLVDNPKAAVEFAKKLGFDIEYFSFESDPSNGVEFRLPRLGKNGYENGKLWLYDPRVAAGSFHDAEYTRAWRISHEIGHALTEPLLQSRYGDSRRYGRLGQELEVTRGVLGKQRQITERALTLNEAQRAVEWEDAAFRAQREVLKQLGVEISDPDFAREYNVNLSDAVYRVLGGNFGDPALSGFVPNDVTHPLKDVLSMLASAESALARSQGRAPTKGIDLANYQPISATEIKQVLENRASGVKDVKFAARANEVMDYRVVVKDGQGNEIDGTHQDLLFNNEDDAADHITRMADEHAGPAGGAEVDHNHYWSQVSKGGKIDRTFAIEPVSKNPFKGQMPRGDGTPAKRFLGEFEKQYPQGGDIGERLVNGNTAISMVSDPVNEGTAYVAYVRSLTPGQGDGTKAMRDVVGMADKHGITLELNAVPFGPNGLPNSKLLEWYKKLGFVMHGEPGQTAWGATSQFMRRIPSDSPQQIEPYATNAGKGISAEDAAEVLRHAKAMFPQAVHHLARSIEDTPHEVQAIAAMRGLTDRVQAAYVRDYDGTHVWMVQNNMRSVGEALQTMVEENVGHDGIAKTFGPEMGNLMDGFLRNEALRPAIIAMAAREGINLAAAKTPLERKEALRAAAEEWLAHGATREAGGQSSPWALKRAVGDAVAAIKVWAATKGLPITLGRPEALSALSRAHRYVTSGSWMTRISEAREQAAGEKVKFAAVPPSGNADLDELLNDKIGSEKVGWRTRLSGAMTDIRSRMVISGLDRMYRVKQYEDDLKVPPAESGYISMRLSTNVAPLLRNLIEFGHLQWTPTLGADADKSMTPDFKEGKPLNEIYAPLGNDPAMLRRFEGYMVALRGRELMPQGREKNLEQRHIQAGLDLATQYPHFVTMQKELMAIHKNMLDFAEGGGVVDPESRKMWESDYYVPLYRVTDEAGGGPWSAGSMAKVRNPIMRLMGSKEKVNDVTGNIVRNWSTLINASIKAHAVRVAVDNLSQAGVAVRVPALERAGDSLVPTSEINKLLAQHGITDSLSPSAVGGIQKLMSLSTPQGDDIVQVWRGGKREYYRLSDPSLATAFSALKGSALRNLEDDPIGKVVVGLGRGAKSVFTKLTTENPIFGVRTLYKDNINAWTVGRGYMPVTPIVSAISGLVKTMRGSESFKRMAAAGATFNAGRADPYDANLTAQRYIKSPSIAGRTWDFYRDMMTSGENASRVTIYERTMAETGSHKASAYEARDLMDYAMRGSSPIIQFFVETVPFWGAHVQGIYKTARSFVPENSMSYSQLAAGAAKRMAPIMLKGMLLSLASAGLYLHNRDNQSYQELSDLDKELYYNIFVGDYRIKIPKAFESGTVFGTVPELIMDAAMSHDPQVTKEDAQSLIHAFGAGLNLYPRVAAVTPLWELMTNHDTSTGAPILNDFDKKLMPQEQVSPGTSAAVTAAARAMPTAAPEALQSPKQLQHLVRGYLGIMGSYGLTAADYLYRKAASLPAAADRNLQQIPMVGSLVTRTDQPPTQTRSLTELSNVMIEANKVADTIKELRKKEDDESQDRADQIEKENEELLNAGDQMRPLYEDIRKLNNAKRQIQGDPNMTSAEKQAQINDIQKDIDEEARDAFQYRPGSKLSKELLEKTTSAVTPAEKARILRANDMPQLASIITQFAKGVPPTVQAAIEELS